MYLAPRLRRSVLVDRVVYVVPFLSFRRDLLDLDGEHVQVLYACGEALLIEDWMEECDGTGDAGGVERAESLPEWYVS